MVWATSGYWKKEAKDQIEFWTKDAALGLKDLTQVVPLSKPTKRNQLDISIANMTFQKTQPHINFISNSRLRKCWGQPRSQLWQQLRMSSYCGDNHFFVSKVHRRKKEILDNHRFVITLQKSVMRRTVMLLADWELYITYKTTSFAWAAEKIRAKLSASTMAWYQGNLLI